MRKLISVFTEPRHEDKIQMDNLPAYIIFWVTLWYPFIHSAIQLSESSSIIPECSRLLPLPLREEEREEGGQEAVLRRALGWVICFPFPWACHSLSQGVGEGRQARNLSMVWERGTGLVCDCPFHVHSSYSLGCILSLASDRKSVVKWLPSCMLWVSPSCHGTGVAELLGW